MRKDYNGRGSRKAHLSSTPLVMAETNGNSSAVASVAIVVLVVVALIAAYFLFFADRGADTGPTQPSIELDVNGPNTRM